LALRPDNAPMQVAPGGSVLAYSQACPFEMRHLQENGPMLSAQFSPRSTD